jgi:hypothetical protein
MRRGGSVGDSLRLAGSRRAGGGGCGLTGCPCRIVGSARLRPSARQVCLPALIVRIHRAEELEQRGIGARAARGNLLRCARDRRAARRSSARCRGRGRCRGGLGLCRGWRLRGWRRRDGGSPGGRAHRLRRACPPQRPEEGQNRGHCDPREPADHEPSEAAAPFAPRPPLVPASSTAHS